ncbi:MAG: hypothetical protein AB8F74_08155 [Saprospiraceae bacterium]
MVFIQSIITSSLLLFCFSAKGQTNQWKLLQSKMEKLGMVIAPPLENRFKLKEDLQDFQPSDVSMIDKNGNLEIRFFIDTSASVLFPHINTMSFLTNLATNSQETVVSLLPIAEDIVRLDYKAQWACQAFFRPKDSFSNKAHCKLIAIYKEGKAVAYMTLLFDDVSLDLEPYEFFLTFDD